MVVPSSGTVISDFLAGFDALANGIRHFAGFAQSDANAALAVADDDEAAEGEAAAALDHLGHAVDLHDALFEFRSIAFVSAS